MNRSFVRGIVIAVAVCSLPASDAFGQWFHAQWFHGHHHHYGYPNCGGDLLIWEPIVPVPVFAPLWQTTIVVQPPISVAPLAPAFSPPPVRQPAVGDVENFARKEMIPDRPVDQAGPLPADQFSNPDEIRRRAGVLKRSTAEGRMRADRLISGGDQAFSDQNLARATARYREAIAKAPDYAEAHFRLAHAYVATRRYNLALKCALVALELANTSRRDGFSLEDMYQGDQFPREQQLNRLIDASLREPHDGGLQFLIGFTLHYDAQRELAQTYFRKAQQLDGIHKPYVRYFLPVKPVAEPLEAAN